ncbi:MAG: hypothetical protein JST73_02775 [Actinobacteria bacterium]|nr:hypothetical protein [Actinomycetota bacterium]
MFGSAVAALLGAFFLAISTVGQKIGMAQLTGPVTVGYKGPVGNHFAYAILLAYAGVALLVGAVLSTARDGDPEVGAHLQGLETPVAVLPPRGTNHWPFIGAFGAGMVVLGLTYSMPLFLLGLLALGFCVIQWSIYAWAEHATADPYANRNVRHQLTYPVDFPLFAILSIALFVFAVSRVLLALPKPVDLVVFGGVPAVAFVVAIILNAKPQWSRGLVSSLAVVGVAVVLGLGVWGMVKGPKVAEKHENTPHPYQIVRPSQSQGSAEIPISVRVARKEIR